MMCILEPAAGTVGEQLLRGSPLVFLRIHLPAIRHGAAVDVADDGPALLVALSSWAKKAGEYISGRVVAASKGLVDPVRSYNTRRERMGEVSVIGHKTSRYNQADQFHKDS